MLEKTKPVAILTATWQSHAKSPDLQSRQVTHQNREFTRELADPVP